MNQNGLAWPCSEPARRGPIPTDRQ